jgi:hypothetical protein
VIPEIKGEGVYFALSYRNKVVCIDSGIQSILDQFIMCLTDRRTLDEVDNMLSIFLEDYSEAWYKDPRTGEVLVLEKLTSSVVVCNPPDMKFAPRQLRQHVLTLSPHFKVPSVH